jgi:O-antigen ligase
VSGLLGWSLFAFGGVYLWGASVAAAGSVLVLLAAPSPGLRSGRLPILDALLAASVLYVAFQLLPLPAAIGAALSPASGAIVSDVSLAPLAPARPLSIDPRSTGHALVVSISIALAFWGARATFHFGGIRTVARGVTLWALVASLLGILQDASRTRQVYWWWTPMSEGPPGFGPFINRNHFAAWALLALGLTLGYLAARTHRSDPMDRFRSFASRLRRRMDGRTVWLLAAIGLLIVALVLTLSRSAMTGAAVAVVATHVLAGSHAHRGRRWWLAGAGALVLAALWTGPGTLLDRWQTAEAGQTGRLAIWRDTLPVVRDFWLTGTGAGTYAVAMTVYQETDRQVHFNQAHNQYLQLLSEGGIILLALSVAAMVVFVREARDRLRSDHTGMFWMRTGAAAGLGAIAIQSVWETAARMPANALLAATLAAIVLHDPHQHAGHTPPRPDTV